jgi:hypothetical protein
MDTLLFSFLGFIIMLGFLLTGILLTKQKDK